MTHNEIVGELDAFERRYGMRPVLERNPTGGVRASLTEDDREIRSATAPSVQKALKVLGLYMQDLHGR